jgi:hypothetical protein
MRLTQHDWQRWFEVAGVEAARLVVVQRTLLEAGICACPETVVGMSRSLLSDPAAAAKLRVLADVWEQAGASPVDAPSGWPLLETPRRVAGAHRCRRRP